MKRERFELLPLFDKKQHFNFYSLVQMNAEAFCRFVTFAEATLLIALITGLFMGFVLVAQRRNWSMGMTLLVSLVGYFVYIWQLEAISQFLFRSSETICRKLWAVFLC